MTVFAFSVAAFAMMFMMSASVLMMIMMLTPGIGVIFQCFFCECLCSSIC